MASTPQSLIMGVAARYTIDQVLPFLVSLRSTGYRGRVCLFISRLSGDGIEQVRSLADEVIDLDARRGHALARDPPHRPAITRALAAIRRTRGARRSYPALFRLAAIATAASRRREMERTLEGYQSLRYRIYLDYLERRPTHADRVLLCDVRDVIFQTDPFARPPAGELEVVLEAAHVTIGADPFNGRWIQSLYGAKCLSRIADRTVSCSGTTLGTDTGIRRYLRLMCDSIARFRRPLGAHDQGIHNYLLWTGRLDPAVIHRNGHGPILTLGAERRLHRDNHGRLLNSDASVAPVVHQYDRHPELALELWSHPRFSLTRSETERRCHGGSGYERGPRA